MLTREQSPNSVLHFTIICEIDKTQITEEKVRQRLGDSLLWLDGVGHVDVNFEGEMVPADE